MRSLAFMVLVPASVILAACSDQSRMPTSPLVGLAAATAKAPTPTTVNVTTVINDADASGNLLLTRSDDYNGAGFATYTTISGHGGNTTSSWITLNGGWQILLNNQTTRTLYLVLASQGMTGIPDGRYSANMEAYSRCFDANNTQVSLLAMAPGTSNGNCTFGMDFSSGGTKYKLALGPDYDAASPTGRTTVTCNTVANGSCTSWTIVPNASTATTFTLTNGQVVTAPVANLYRFGNRGDLVFVGSYHNSFSVSATE